MFVAIAVEDPNPLDDINPSVLISPLADILTADKSPLALIFPWTYRDVPAKLVVFVGRPLVPIEAVTDESLSAIFTSFALTVELALIFPWTYKAVPEGLVVFESATPPLDRDWENSR